jgi:hypothetical protein
LQARDAVYVYDAANAGVAGTVPVGSYRAQQQQQEQEGEQQEVYYPGVMELMPTGGQAAAPASAAAAAAGELANTAVVSPSVAGEAAAADAGDVGGMAADGGESPAPLAAGQYVCLPSKLRF